MGGHAGGRPLRFQTVDELQKAIDAYFESCWANVPVIGAFGPVMVDDTDKPCEIKINKKTGEQYKVYPKKQLTEYKQVKPYTLSGLANAIGVDRRTLLNYGEREEFFPTLLRAKAKCEQYAEEMLFIAKNAPGSIFNLKNNYQCWKDKTEQEVTIKGGIAERLQKARERKINTDC